MIDLILALKKRIERFMLASSITTTEANFSDKSVFIRTSDVQWFNLVSQMETRPKIGIKIANTNITSLHVVHAVNIQTGELTIEPDLIDSVPAGSWVERWPGQMRFNRVYIGGVDAPYDPPAIIIEPTNMHREWVTLPTGADQLYNIDIHVLVQDDGNEEGTLSMLSAAGELDDLLMADLHMRMAVLSNSPSDRPYNSLVQGIDYGAAFQKETGFLKMATLHYFATTYILRIVADLSEDFAQFHYHPGKAWPLQGIDTDDTESQDGIYTNVND